MKYEGNILKMRTEPDTPVRYYLPVGGEEIFLNNFLGREISLRFTGKINCIVCGKHTRTSFGQGFCYNCMQTAPEAGESVLRPELSKAHLGIARDMKWAEQYDLIEHHVYLAASSEIKVGVTRHHQVPYRWIDQGASSAIVVATTPNRHIAGITEVWLKNFYTDKTNWRDMLKNVVIPCDLAAEKQKALEKLPAELLKYTSPNNDITLIEYPAIAFPDKISTHSFDKEPVASGKLIAIKGQYLIFSSGLTVNIRKHGGYCMIFEA